MREVIDQHFVTLEAAKAEIYRTVADLPEEALGKKPAPDKWSLLDLIHHLMLVESFALQQFEETQNQKIKKTWLDRIKFGMAKFALDTGQKIAVPVADVDPGNVTPVRWSELQEEWTDVRRRFRAIVDGLSDEELTYCYFTHPLAGNFTCEDGLIFLVKHWEHHKPQWNKLLARTMLEVDAEANSG